MPAFLSDRLAFLTRAAANGGDVVELRIGRRTFLLKDPDAIHHVLVKNHANYAKSTRLTSARGKRLSGRGLLTSQGAEHLRQRRMMQPSFHSEVVMNFADRIIESADRYMDGWRDGMELDLADEMMAWAHGIMGRILFSADYDGVDRAVGEAVKIRRAHFQYVFRSLLPFPEFLPRPITFRYRRAMRYLDRALEDMIRTRRLALDPPHDLLTILTLSRYEDGTAMTDRQLRDEALTLSVTGYETLGEALSWTWWLLANHPRVDEKFRVEVRRVLAGRTPVYADLAQLSYTRQVLDESLRLYPPTWIYIRIAKGSDALPDGTPVPAGSKIYLCPYVVHRDSRLWPDPERFDPGRFSPEKARGRPRYAFFPFGGGPRVCIGEQLARMEGVLLLARIAQRARFELLEPEVVPSPGLTLRPSPGIRSRIRMPTI